MVNDYTMQAPLYYTNKKNETVHLVEQGVTWKQIHEWSRDRKNDCSLDWLGRNKEGIEHTSAQHVFWAASDPSELDAHFCPCALDSFFLWDTWAFSYPSCSKHSLSHFALDPEW